MAEPLPVATTATPLPSPADIARAEQFTLERFVHEGETADDALAPGSARGRARDAPRAHLAHRHDHPTTPRPRAL
jgi:ribonuclease E